MPLARPTDKGIPLSLLRGQKLAENERTHPDESPISDFLVMIQYLLIERKQIIGKGSSWLTFTQLAVCIAYD
jgi:hypothetical protein